MSDVHVVPHGDSWALEVAPTSRRPSTPGTRRSRGRELAEQEHGELVVHGEAGQVREGLSRQRPAQHSRLAEPEPRRLIDEPRLL